MNAAFVSAATGILGTVLGVLLAHWCERDRAKASLRIESAKRVVDAVVEASREFEAIMDETMGLATIPMAKYDALERRLVISSRHLSLCLCLEWGVSRAETAMQPLRTRFRAFSDEMTSQGISDKDKHVPALPVMGVANDLLLLLPKIKDSCG